MKNLLLLIPAFILVLTSCSTPDDSVLTYEESILIDNPTHTITIDIIYVLSSDNPDINEYDLNEAQYINDLNRFYFHRNDIGLELGETRSIINDELYDLKDNVGSEERTFFVETVDSYKKDRLNIYVIKRSNTRAIAGMGKDRRALITDEFLTKCTSPHEIGHALGLFHTKALGNVMCEDKSVPRKEFSQLQVDIMIRNINRR